MAVHICLWFLTEFCQEDVPASCHPSMLGLGFRPDVGQVLTHRAACYGRCQPESERQGWFTTFTLGTYWIETSDSLLISLIMKRGKRLFHCEVDDADEFYFYTSGFLFPPSFKKAIR